MSISGYRDHALDSVMEQIDRMVTMRVERMGSAISRDLQKIEATLNEISRKLNELDEFVLSSARIEGKDKVDLDMYKKKKDDSIKDTGVRVPDRAFLSHDMIKSSRLGEFETPEDNYFRRNDYLDSMRYGMGGMGSSGAAGSLTTTTGIASMIDGV